ncbi:MAG TPA: 2Fe-2S iron-sulfur cluster-binding protein, partial [Azospirillaceae bacterium]|nr:2Fe-2S iron-sulfur cluster-binding protein [Azospirillaceae bacterium]
MGQGIQFLLNGEEVRVAAPPTLILLDWLRARGLTGAKEGCREGDCGACTVALGEVVDGRLRVKAVNACLVFLPMVDGRLVVTAEGLAEDGGLHPVQEALVERHGSQCGFCTPGMVMSLFALYHAGDAPEAAHEALAGNLCRCTGYRPLVEAATVAARGPADDRLARHAAEMVRRLERLRRDEALTLDGFAAPCTLADLLDLRARQPEARLLAGGTDLGLLVTKQYRHLPAIIAVDRVQELRRIEEAPEAVVLGA